jgi:hypothetical protein
MVAVVVLFTGVGAIVFGVRARAVTAPGTPGVHPETPVMAPSTTGNRRVPAHNQLTHTLAYDPSVPTVPSRPAVRRGRRIVDARSSDSAANATPPPTRHARPSRHPEPLARPAGSSGDALDAGRPAGVATRSGTGIASRPGMGSDSPCTSAERQCAHEDPGRRGRRGRDHGGLRDLHGRPALSASSCRSSGRECGPSFRGFRTEREVPSA